MFKQKDGALYQRKDKELLKIEPWGENSLRIRATQNAEFLPAYYSGLEESESKQTNCAEIQISQDGKSASVINGKIRCEIMPTGKLKFFNQNGKLLLEEYDRNRFRQDIEGEFNSALEISPRTFVPHAGTNNYRVELRFEADKDEKIYGMGQYQQSDLDVKGCILELAQRNSQASVPFALSNKGYGFLWNNPAVGKVVFGKNLTEWVAQSTQQLDYWITAGDTPKEIEEAYAAVTGTVPMMPEYGMGFWQCKLRYQTQEEILDVARRYYKEKIPVSVIVVDYFHWPHQGDWDFDYDYWPDPAAMVRELNEMGMKLMVSIWPTVDAESVNFKQMEEQGLLTRSETGSRTTQLGEACFIDVTNPETRAYVWNVMKKNYYEKGIQIFWLDEAEPEFSKYDFSNFRYYKGSDLEIGNIYPKEYARMAYEGMQNEGQENIVNLIRCAWIGSQKYGALVWSGDIDSSFRSLRSQLAAGLNMGISGIPWWTTDIGGFHGGDIRSDSFKEVFVRWFAFGAFCPVMRLHGFREPFKEPIGKTGGGAHISGAENEIWSYGEDVFDICKKYIHLREKLRPYITRLMRDAHEKGSPIMRPLFYDFPNNQESWKIEDEYMFGPDILVCPILYEGQRSRDVYLPEGEWEDMRSGERFSGNTTITSQAPLDSIPVFVRVGAEV